MDEHYRCGQLGKQHLRLRASFSRGTDALDQYLHERARKEVDHRVARYRLYPATLIGRLAVDQGCQGERLGGRLLIDALACSLYTSRDVASMAVITDAKDDEAQAFYEHYGFRPLPTVVVSSCQ